MVVPGAGDGEGVAAEWAQSFCLRCAKVLGMGGVGGRTAWILRMPLNCPLKNSLNGKFYEYFTAAEKEKEKRNEHTVLHATVPVS